jgi:dipeptidase D
MGKDILKLDPKALWKNFYDLTQIPRPSKHEDRVQAFAMGFGEKLGLETIKDGVATSSSASLPPKGWKTGWG